MNSGLIRNLTLIAADVTALVTAWALALWGYWAVGLGYYGLGWQFYLRLWPLILVFIIINGFFRLYHGNAFSPAAPVTPPEELRRLAGSALLVHLWLIAALAFAYQSTENYSRAAILIASLLTVALAQPFRDLVRAVLKRLGVGQIPVSVLGSAESAEKLRRFFEHDAYWGFAPAAESQQAAVAVISGDASAYANAMSLALNDFTHVLYLPTATLLPVGGARTITIEGRGGIAFVNRRRMRLLRWQKQIMDKMMSVLAFIALSPCFIVIPLIVKLTSRGSVFYRQTRLGKDGEIIRVWKFRTMYDDAEARLQALLKNDPKKRAEWEQHFKLTDDPRITPLGKFLRRTSLDELPQFLNVLEGSMALVGPRPIVEAEKSLYGEAYETFASVKPGVTGLWQVSGRSDTDYSQRVALDTYYVLNWSPWLDLWILIRTIGAVLLMRGAR